MALKPLQPIPFGQDELVIVISKGATPEGHTGFAFFDELGCPGLYHLVDHRKLKHESAANNAGWLVERLNLKPLVSKQIVAYARTVMKWANLLNNIDYGVDFIAARGSFLADGTYQPPAGDPGLTCASFVVEVLRCARIDLIQEGTWKPTLYNADWAENVASFFDQRAASWEARSEFDKARVDRERAATIRLSINGLRLMPTEVVGAAALGRNAWPVSFEDVQPEALRVRQELAAAFP